MFHLYFTIASLSRWLDASAMNWNNACRALLSAVAASLSLILDAALHP
ncbi:hypothetical protein SAMN05421882_10411, partial [Nitrosomonas communis]